MEISETERYKTIFPLVYRHPIFYPEKGMMAEESNEYVEACYESSLDEVCKKGMFLTYLCAPLQPTYKKSTGYHISDALYHASQITGAEYNGKKITIWIPHYHSLTMDNEFTKPGTRDFAISFNGLILKRYRPTLVQVGERISEGMKDEIGTAIHLGLDVVHFNEFKNRLQNLPSPEEVKSILKFFIRSMPPELLYLFSL